MEWWRGWDIAKEESQGKGNNADPTSKDGP
jgi:hypothetical protein